MFDLAQQLAAWRANLAEGSALTGEDIAELEEHLREGMSHLTRQGLNEHEAFVVSRMRLGDAPELELEYGKVNGTLAWRTRLPWLLVGYLGGCAISHAITAIGAVAATASACAGLNGAAVAALSLMVTAACWAALLAFLCRIARHGQVGPERNQISLAWTAGLVAMLVLGGAVGSCARMTYAQLVPAARFAEAMMWTSIGNACLNVCVLVACLLLIFAWRSPRRLQLATP